MCVLCSLLSGLHCTLHITHTQGVNTCVDGWVDKPWDVALQQLNYKRGFEGRHVANYSMAMYASMHACIVLWSTPGGPTFPVKAGACGRAHDATDARARDAAWAGRAERQRCGGFASEEVMYV